VIRDMLLDGKTSYGEFLASEEKIATNILSTRLAQLESDGLIHKERDPNNGTKNIYTLTEKGLDLAPLFVEMMLWSAQYHDVPENRRQAVTAAQADRQKFGQMIRAARTGKGSITF